MKASNYLISIALLAIALAGCGKKPENPSKYTSDTEIATPTKRSIIDRQEKRITQKLEQEIQGITYRIIPITALNYLERIGEQINPNDKKILKEEAVFMLEIRLKETHKNIFSHTASTMLPEQATQYLIGDIIHDFSIIQNKEKFYPNGVQYDGKIGHGNRLRITFFTKGIDLNKPYTIHYQDRLFGKGLIKINKYNPDIIH